MPVQVKIPSMGESITEVVLTKWHKSTGDWVDKDEDLYEVESDKITTDVQSNEAGVISLSAEEGAELNVGAVVATIDTSAKPPAAAKKKKQSSPQAALRREDHPRAAAAAGSTTAMTTTTAVSTEPNGAATDEGARATSVARKIAAERGIDLDGVQGTGPSGRITKSDVLAVSEGAGAPASVPSAPASVVRRAGERSARREKMTKLRRRIAERLVHATNTTAMLTTFNEVDLTEVIALRTKYKETFLEKYGVGLGFMSFFVKASISALREFPRVNAFIVENEVEYHDFVDLSIAVSTERGLTVPILRDVDQMTFAQIESGIKDLAMRAREGDLTMDDLTGGTFTITNGGIFGSLNSTPILNPPQSGILGIHAIKNRPVEDPDNPGRIALRPMMNLALSYDHRIVDGAEAVRFLVHVKECIEHPERIMLEV